MKKKRLAALAVAFALVLSLSASVLALTGITLGEFISLGFNKGDFPDYTYAEWESMSIDERRSALESPVIKYRGTPHFTDDFLSDTKNSHNAYEGFVNGYSVLGGVIPNIASSIYLEKKGQADLRLGFYNDDYNGTAAGELNNDFLDYIQKYPYVGQDTPSTAYKFSNGYYVDWEPLLIGSGPNSFSVGGVTHSCKRYGLRFYLHDETGKIIDMVDHKGYNSYTPLLICDVCGGGLFDNFTITSEGQYYFDCHPWDIKHTASYFDVVQSAKYSFPWWSQYGAPTEEPVVTDPVATGTDENGNEIQFNINSDGVTYEGNTYNYNDDNSVTINGNTYHITVNPADVNEDYYNQFLQQVINNYYNYYGTDSTPFDDKDIISAVKSVFTSLETFRSYCYSQLKQIGDYISVGFNSMRASLKKIIDRLDDIIKYLKDISKNVEELTEEQEEKNKSDWDDLISLFKDKVGWASLDKSMRNIQTAFFGERVYTQSSSGEIQVQILQKNAAPINSSMPELSIIYMGQSYNLYSLVSYFGSDIEPIKDFISVFLWVGFFVSLFRSIPTILGGVATFDGHSSGSNSTSKKGG